jgi:uncharacterized membrane protein YidH (DUF202 family)
MQPSDDPEDADPGLARERTRLAWTRTALAFAAVGVAVLRKEVIPGVIVLATTPLIYAVGQFASHTAPGSGPRPGRLLVVTVTITLVAALAVIAALLSHGPTSLHDLLHV